LTNLTCFLLTSGTWYFSYIHKEQSLQNIKKG